MEQQEDWLHVSRMDADDATQIQTKVWINVFVYMHNNQQSSKLESIEQKVVIYIRLFTHVFLALKSLNKQE